MKRLLGGLPLCLLVVFLLTGAAPRHAPIVPTVDYYVNDAANVIFDEHRSHMMMISADLDEKTGVQIVVLAVDAISGGGTMWELAEAVFADWEIGREDRNGVLILTLSNPTDCVVYVGESLQQSLDVSSIHALEANLRDAMKTGNISKAIMDCYKNVAEHFYTLHDIAPSQEISNILSTESSRGLNISPFLILLGIVLLTARSMRIARRNQKRNKGPIRKRKQFVKKTTDEDPPPHLSPLRNEISNPQVICYNEPEDIYLDEEN